MPLVKVLSGFSYPFTNYKWAIINIISMYIPFSVHFFFRFYSNAYLVSYQNRNSTNVL